MSVLRVRDPFSCDIGGVFRVYRIGDLVDSADPVVTPSRMQFLETVEEAAQRTTNTVETATAAPNERRSLPLPIKTTSRLKEKP